MPSPTPVQKLKASISRAVFGEKRRQPATPNVLAQASRAAMAAVAYDATSWIQSATEHMQQALARRSTQRIWLPSFLGLGATDIAFSSSRLSRAAKGLALVGAAGGAGLMAASSLDLWHAKTPEEVLDASGDLAWGAQGLSYIAAAPATARLVAGLGLVGAAAQMSAGVMRIARGVSLRDMQALKLGGLDLSGGILWAALDVAGWSNPVVLGSYVVLMVGREAYANRDALRKSWSLRRSFRRVAGQDRLADPRHVTAAPLLATPLAVQARP
jgi:hypothetical protein